MRNGVKNIQAMGFNGARTLLICIVMHNHKNFLCAHIIWMNHNINNQMNIFGWRFSALGIFGI